MRRYRFPRNCPDGSGQPLCGQRKSGRVRGKKYQWPEYTEETISNLVDKIIDSQVTEGYFKECPITFKDIATVKAVFKEKLKIAYHTRISYPELKK